MTNTESETSRLVYSEVLVKKYVLVWGRTRSRKRILIGSLAQRITKAGQHMIKKVEAQKLNSKVSLLHFFATLKNFRTSKYFVSSKYLVFNSSLALNSIRDIVGAWRGQQ